MTMTATTFNPLAIARELEATGIERRQAEAIAEGIHQAAGADHDALATKADLAGTKADLESRFASLEVRMYRALWIQGAAIVGVQIAIAGLIVSLLP